MTVFIDRKISPSALHLLTQAGINYIAHTENRALSQQELIDACQPCDALLTAGTNAIDKTFLHACRHLKVISLHSVGYDRVDIQEATRLKIPIGNTPDVLSEATADTALLLMLAVSRKAIFLHKKILKGEWGFSQPIDDLGVSLEGKTLGIFGLGNIGYRLAKKASAAFNMPVLYHNRSANEEAEKELNAKRVSFDELLQKSDVVVAFSALTPDTKNKFNKEAFAKMKNTAIFINASRGGVHNEIDLTEALEKGIIWGAGLDVTNPEPMDPNHVLLNMPNVVIFPHIGSATEEARSAMGQRAAENVIAALHHKPLPSLVNKELKHTAL